MKTDVLIVGAGFAGAATAFQLSQYFDGSIFLIDKEEVPGFHASGRNASQVLQSTDVPEIRHLVAASRRAYTQYRQAVGFHECGSLLLGTRDQLERVREPELIVSEYKDREEVRCQIPVLQGHDFESALWTPSDGVIDIAALLHFFLQGARSRGVSLWLDCEVQEIKTKGCGFALTTSRGEIEATCVLNAAGAWASGIAQMAGVPPLPLSPLKRHLFVLGGTSGLDPAKPFVWSVQHNFYFRPESGDLLFSLCDEEATESLEPTVNPEIAEALAELIWNHLPGLREANQKRIWSCFRTKTPDGRPVLGWDPRAENFFWIAGLAGHGVGICWEIGRLAAERFLTRDRSPDDPFSPTRFLSY